MVDRMGLNHEGKAAIICCDRGVRRRGWAGYPPGCTSTRAQTRQVPARVEAEARSTPSRGTHREEQGIYNADNVRLFPLRQTLPLLHHDKPGRSAVYMPDVLGSVCLDNGRIWQKSENPSKIDKIEKIWKFTGRRDFSHPVGSVSAR